MHERQSVAATIIGAMLFATAALNAQKTVSAVKGWVKTPAAGEQTATAFVFVQNPTMYDVYIMSAETAAAGSVELQKTNAAGKAEKVENFNVPAYDALDMKPTTAFLLLKDLKRPLKDGDTVNLALTTDGGITLTVSASVRPNAP